MKKIIFLPIFATLMLGLVVYLEFEKNDEYEELQVEYDESRIDLDKINLQKNEEPLEQAYEESNNLPNGKQVTLEEAIEHQQKRIAGMTLEQAYELIYNQNKLNQEEQIIRNQLKPITTINDQNINWNVSDSKGNTYNWIMPIETYEYYLRASEPQDILSLTNDVTGEIFTVRDHRQFVQNSFKDVIDEVYVNSISDQDFVYEVWYIVSQLTTFSYDIDEDPRWALETLSRGGGDCEDSAILIIDMLKSSKHTQSWKIELVYFDSDNPQNPKTPNHVAIHIDDGQINYLVESTEKVDPYVWSDGVTGWFFEV